MPQVVGEGFSDGAGFGVRFEGSVAVALDVSAKCFTEGFDELIRSAVDAPVVEVKKGAPISHYVPFSLVGLVLNGVRCP